MKNLLVLFFFLLSCHITNAQWYPINGPGGGNIALIEKKGDTLAVIYERDGVHPYEPMYFSTNHGAIWDSRIFNPTDGNYILGINGLVINDSIYFTSGSGAGIFKTFLYEGEWLTVRVGLKESAISSLESDGEILYAGIWSGNNEFDWGVYISKNGGVNWINTLTKKVNCIKIIDDIVYAGGYDGIHYSNDSGDNWFSLSPNLKSYINDVVDFSIDDNRIFVMGYDELVFSINNGDNWITIEKKEEWGEINAVQITSNNLIVATDNGLFISNDSGESWRSLSFSLLNQKFNTITCISDTIYAGGNNGKVIFSSDGGDTWNNFGNAIPYISVYDMVNCGNNLLASTSEGVLFSNNEGETWQNINYDFPQTNLEYFPLKTISKFATDGLNKVFAATDNGEIFVSNDKGISWIQLYDAFDEMSEILKMTYADNKLILATKKQILLSNNNGASWSYLRWNEMGNILSIVFKNNKLYAAIKYEGIYSVDLSSQYDWKLLDNSFEHLDYGVFGKNLEIYNNDIFITNGERLYKSNLNNINWEQTSLFAKEMWNINVGQNRILIISSFDEVYINQDNGEWISFSEGLPVSGIPLYPVVEKLIYMNGFIFALTPNHGIWKSPYQYENTTYITHFRNEDCYFYPNPIDDAVSFFWSESPLEMNLTILNLQGQQVFNKIITKNSPVNINPLKNGVYLYRLSNKKSNFRYSGKLMVK